uniref:DM2 domain-containing protein n=1 Tax=Vombatus ursinus TaxID=29139 RepID=A0A4X2L9L9_VOMUR
MALPSSQPFSTSHIPALEPEALVRPKLLLLKLLKFAGAQKDTFTMKEVLFYLGQYILSRQVYDKKQQHIVCCSDDLLGDLRLYAVISRNLISVSQQAFASPNASTNETRCQLKIGSGQKESMQELQEENSGSMILINNLLSSSRRTHSETGENWDELPGERHRKWYKSDFPYV